MKKCKVCGGEFEKSEVGRLRIAKRKEKGEDIVWVCSTCAKHLRFEGGQD